MGEKEVKNDRRKKKTFPSGDPRITYVSRGRRTLGMFTRPPIKLITFLYLVISLLSTGASIQ